MYQRLSEEKDFEESDHVQTSGRLLGFLCSKSIEYEEYGVQPPTFYQTIYPPLRRHMSTNITWIYIF